MMAYITYILCIQFFLLSQFYKIYVYPNFQAPFLALNLAKILFAIIGKQADIYFCRIFIKLNIVF